MAERDFAEMELEEYRRQKLEQRKRMAQPAKPSPAQPPRLDPLLAKRRREQTTSPGAEGQVGDGAPGTGHIDQTHTSKGYTS